MEKLFFSENMKHLREVILKCKQSEIPDFTGIKQTTWSNYETGVSTPSLSGLNKLSEIFGISVNDLLYTELAEEMSKNAKYNPDELSQLLRKTASKSAHKGGGNSKNHAKTLVADTKEGVSNGRKLSPKLSPTLSPTVKKDHISHSIKQDIRSEPGTIYGARTPSVVTINEHGIDNILYVPIKAQAGYLLGYADKEYIEQLPSFRMPGLGNQTFRMFEVEGISMSPTLSDKDRVIAEWVPNVMEIRENRVHVVVHKEGVAIKRVLNRVKERDKIYLKSDTLTFRQDYPIKEIDPADVIEIWYVRLKVSGDLSEPSEVYTRLADLELNQHEIMKKLGLMKK